MISRTYKSHSGIRLVEVGSLVADRTFVAESEFRSSSKMLWLYTEAGTKTAKRIHRPYLVLRKFTAAERLIHILRAIDICKRCPPTREGWRLYALGYVAIKEAGCDDLTAAGRQVLERWRKQQMGSMVA